MTPWPARVIGQAGQLLMWMGAGLIGLESMIPIVPFIPMFMFAILFGLSMDYEVFLLSRVREEYLLTGDYDSSVIHGIATTGRVITCAALIIISVFMGFVLGDDPTAKVLGLGLATAILVDATLVRLVLVPAIMKLLGEANWWIPRWLDRLLPTLDAAGEADPLPDPVAPGRAHYRPKVLERSSRTCTAHSTARPS